MAPPLLRTLCLSLTSVAVAACSGSTSASNPMSNVTSPPAPSAAAAAAATVAIADPGNPPATPPPTPPPGAKVPSHHRCAWLNDDVGLGTASLVANAEFFDAVHPYWWTLAAGGNVAATSFVDDATIVATAHAHSIKLMPLVYGGDDASAIRNAIGSPSAIAAHANVLVQLAVARQYDGIELDYEHLWSASDRAGYTALVTQIAAGLHAHGKELSLAVPAIAADNGGSGYDYAALVSAGADVIHLMGYDFHSIGGDHLGPLAPIGWIDAVAARVEALGAGAKFVLGIANYGVGSGWYANSADAIAMCGAGYPTTTTHMSICPSGNYAAGIAPHCTTSKGAIWFEDGASTAEKARTAQAHGLRGIAYYTLGGESPGVFDAIKAAYP
ncbi:MAG: hypothetical protein JWM53_2134 [bacterium]|nr:hypothetical protein [bacterium]